MSRFQHMYRNHLDCEFFFKADDDTYVIVENLKLMLSNYSSEDALFFGYWLKGYGGKRKTHVNIVTLNQP